MGDIMVVLAFIACAALTAMCVIKLGRVEEDARHLVERWIHSGYKVTNVEEEIIRCKKRMKLIYWGLILFVVLTTLRAFFGPNS